MPSGRAGQESQEPGPASVQDRALRRASPTPEGTRAWIQASVWALPLQGRNWGPQARFAACRGGGKGQPAPPWVVTKLPPLGAGAPHQGGRFVPVFLNCHVELVFAPCAFSPLLGLSAGYGRLADRPYNWELGDPREPKADGFAARRNRGVQNSSLRALPGCG